MPHSNSLDGTDSKSPEVAQDSAQKIPEAAEEIELSKWTTTRWELWSYYLFYVGNNGLSGFNFGPSQFQNLLFLAGYDPSGPPFSMPCGDAGCVLPYLGKVRDGAPFFPRRSSMANSARI